MVQALCTAARLAAVRLSAQLCVEYVSPAARAMLEPQHIAPGASWPGPLEALGGLDLREDLACALDDPSVRRREVALGQGRAVQVAVQRCITSGRSPTFWVVFAITACDALATMLQQALDAMPAHVALLDRQGRIEWTNEAWAHRLRGVDGSTRTTAGTYHRSVAIG